MHQLKHEKTRKDWKIAMMTVAVVMIFFITWLPFIVFCTVSIFNKNSLSLSVYLCTSALTTFSSLINSYIVLQHERRYE